MDNKNHNLVSIVMIIVLVIISTLLILNVVGRNKVNEYKTDDFKLSFDRNWNIGSKSVNKLELIHKSKSLFKVDIIVLDEEYRRSELSLLIDEILAKVEKDNPKYRLVNKEETLVANKGYDAYQYLYETNNEQAMITIGKRNDIIFVLTYAANHEFFDILLDSVKEIVWSFEII